MLLLTKRRSARGLARRPQEFARPNRSLLQARGVTAWWPMTQRVRRPLYGTEPTIVGFGSGTSFINHPILGTMTSYDGAGDGTNFGDTTILDGATSCAIAFIMVPDTAGDENDRMIAKWGATAALSAFTVAKANGFAGCIFGGVGNGSATSRYRTTNAVLTAGKATWVVWNWLGGDSHEIWVDGINQSLTAISSTSVASIANTTSSLYFASQAGSANKYDGGLCDVMFMRNRVWTPAECRAHYDPRSRWDFYTVSSRRLFVDAPVGGGTTILPQMLEQGLFVSHGGVV